MDLAEKRSWNNDRRGRQYSRQTVPVLESAVSCVTGLCIAWNLGGKKAMVSCFDPIMFLSFLPVAGCFALGLSVKMMAVNYFQAGTVKIVGQLRLPLSALMSLAVGRTYTMLQWQAILMITSSCACFVMVKGQRRSQQGERWKWTGLCQLFGWVCLNVIGGLLAEKLYKRPDYPVYVQKVAQDFGHFCVSAFMLYVVLPVFSPSEDIRNPKERPGGFFDSWDMRTVAVTAFLFLDAWLGTMLLKEFSAVTRCVAKCVGVAIVYLISLSYSIERRNNPVLTVVALLVIQSSVLHACL